MWVELALFLVWLTLPVLYVVVLGRSYVRRCAVLYQQLRDHGCACDCCTSDRLCPHGKV